ncbi:MAG: toll/interleukin-1 receptor domain-containing protein [Alphaproteobacteria bacterium]|nr:toll/interleukin-1 receptor domain-containing protein [Alphaproteobacteria bacterium]
MAYLAPHYAYDIFVSYATTHSDRSGESPLATWTHALVRNLVHSIRDLDPRFDDLNVWLDEHYDPTVGLTSELKNSVSKSALLLIIMSPSYLRSDWCGRERDWFAAEVHARQQDQRPVFIIKAVPTSEQKWPSFLRDDSGEPPVGFRFHDGQLPLPYGRGDPQSLDYRQELIALRTEVIRSLSEIDRSLREIDSRMPPSLPPARQQPPSIGDPGSRVFLCHASEDKPAVKELYQRLKSSGFSPWLDEEDLVAGQNWALEIRKAISAARVVLVCLSARSEKRGHVQKEIVHALDVADQQPEGRIFLIPVLMEPCPIPDRLDRWHAVDLFKENGYRKLEDALRLALSP